MSPLIQLGTPGRRVFKSGVRDVSEAPASASITGAPIPTSLTTQRQRRSASRAWIEPRSVRLQLSATRSLGSTSGPGLLPSAQPAMPSPPPQHPASPTLSQMLVSPTGYDETDETQETEDAQDPTTSDGRRGPPSPIPSSQRNLLAWLERHPTVREPAPSSAFTSILAPRAPDAEEEAESDGENAD